MPHFKCVPCARVFVDDWQEAEGDEDESAGYPYCPKCKRRDYVNESIGRAATPEDVKRLKLDTPFYLIHD